MIWIILLSLLFIGIGFLSFKIKYEFPIWTYACILGFCSQKEASIVMVTARTFFDVFTSTYNVKDKNECELTALACTGLALKYHGVCEMDLIKRLARLGPVEYKEKLVDGYGKIEHLFLKCTLYDINSILPKTAYEMDQGIHEALIIIGTMILNKENLNLMYEKRFSKLPFLFWFQSFTLVLQRTVQRARTRQIVDASEVSRL